MNKTNMRMYLQLLLALSVGGRSETFDYVIAGAGTAGLVVANRLSEDATINVAVIEPGDDVRDNPGVMDVDASGAVFNASIDWAYASVTQPNLNVSITYHAGKAIGGTSNINGGVLHHIYLLKHTG
jgi:choline dehydrogenase